MNAEEKGAIRTFAGGANLPVTSLTEGGRLDLTYRRIVDLSIVGKSLELSLFIGAILERCNFEAVNFNRCDFSGTKFIDCTFSRCSFVPIEVRSCYFKACKFYTCDLRSSQWTSSQMDDTLFEDCDLREATIRETVFSNSGLTACNLYRNSITLDRFDRCSFNQIDFGDCTAQFIFFDHCTFTACRFSTECIGYTYGISLADLSSSELTYLGQAQDKPQESDLADALLANYLERRWFVGACALELNFRRLSPALSLRNLVSRLGPDAVKNKRVDWDELQFLTLILQRLYSEMRLPLVGLWPLFRFAQDSFATLQDEFPASRSFASAPQLVVARLEKLLDDTLDEIGQMTLSDTGYDTWLELTLQFVARPAASLNKILPRKIFALYGINQSEMVLVSAKSGSWAEVWQLTAGALATIQLSLVAVNGMMGQLVKLGKKTQQISDLFRRKKAQPKSGARRKSRKKATRPGKELAMSTLVASLVDQKHVLAGKVPNLSDQSLARLDRTILIMLALTDEELHRFEDYSDTQLEFVEVKARHSKRSRT